MILGSNVGTFRLSEPRIEARFRDVPVISTGTVLLNFLPFSKRINRRDVQYRNLNLIFAERMAIL